MKRSRRAIVGAVAGLSLGPAIWSATAQASSAPIAASRHAGAVPVAGLGTADRTGFGRATTGGAGGPIVLVSTPANDGPGSLRAALAGDAPRWVVFAHDLTIKVSRPIEVGSNKTIDGRGHHVTLTGHGVQGLDLVRVHNVIVESLVLHDFGDIAKTKNNDKADAIHIQASRGIWIDHNDLSMAGDKLIAVAGGSQNVTVSWNRFHHQQQVFQIGDQSDAVIDAAQTVTVHHNFFDHTGYRNPVVSYGKAHVYDNYFLDWQLYAVRSERTAQVYLENNVFQPGKSDRASIVTPGGDGCNDARTRCDTRPGSLRAVGNLLMVKKTKILQNAPQAVFAPARAYPYLAEPATGALAQRVALHTGPQTH